MMTESKTDRGFDLVQFVDENGGKCSLQKSSVATKDCIWLGCELQAYVEGKLWDVEHEPGSALVKTRMHLTVEQVKALLPYLQRFVETGEIIEE